MGGRTAMGMVAHAPDGLRGLVVGGMGPKGPQLEDEYTQERLLAAARGGTAIAAVAAALEQIGDLGEALAAASVEALFFCGSLDPLNADARRGAERSSWARASSSSRAWPTRKYKGGIVEAVPVIRELLATL